MTTPSADEPARDAHLRAALRHAPDAGLAAPEALHRHILRAARAQAASSTTHPPGPTLGARIGAWLAVLTRPPMASGLAGVMVAVLGGWLWWGQPLDIRQPLPEAAEAPLRSTPPRPAPVEPEVTAAPQAEPTAPSVVVKPSPARERRTVEEAPRLPVPAPKQPMAAPPPSAQADAAQEASPAATRTERELAAGAAPAPAAPAVASTAPAPTEARELHAEAERSLDRARRAERSRIAPAAAPAFARPPAPVVQGAPTLQALRQQMQTAPADWRAQLSLGPTRELRGAPEVATLLDTLQALTGDRWQAAPHAEASPPQALLLLQAPGGATQTLRLHADRIEWLRPDGAPVQALLSAEQATAARRAFEAAAMR